MWIPLAGLLLGILVGLLISPPVPSQFTRYVAMMILAALDSVLGAIRSEMRNEFDNSIFLSGFVMNSVFAGAMTYLGDRLGVELHLAAIVAFGVRIFQNIAVIRRLAFSRR